MTWEAAMRWARIFTHRCRVVMIEGEGMLSDSHRHKVKAYRPASTGGAGWAYSVTCTNDPTRHRAAR